MADWIGEAAKTFGVGCAVLLVIGAAAYTAVKVLRSDQTLSSIIERLESERDYFRDQLTRERTDAAAMEERLNAKLDAQAEAASKERTLLIAQVQEMRESLQQLTLQLPEVET